MVNIAEGTQPTTVIILNFDDLTFKVVTNIKSSIFLLNEYSITKIKCGEQSISKQQANF